MNTKNYIFLVPIFMMMNMTDKYKNIKYPSNYKKSIPKIKLNNNHFKLILDSKANIY